MITITYHNVQDRLSATESATLSSMRHRLVNLVASPYVISYLHGNMPKEVAEVVHQKMISAARGNGDYDTTCLGRPETDPISDYSRPSLLDRGKHSVLALPTFNEEDANNALICYMQADLTSPQMVAQMIMLRQLLAEPMFTELRTKQQLGYIVGVSAATFGKGEGKVRLRTGML